MDEQLTSARRGGNPNWRPGVSGNPAGRKPMPVKVKKLLDEMTEPALQVVFDTLKSNDPKLSFAAAQEVLNRTLGKPLAQAAVSVTSQDNSMLHLQALIDAANKAIELQPMPTIDVDPRPVMVGVAAGAALVQVEDEADDEKLTELLTDGSADGRGATE